MASVSTFDFNSAYQHDVNRSLVPTASQLILSDPLEFLDDNEVMIVLQQTGFWQELDTFEEQVAIASEQNAEVTELVVETATVAGSALTVGYILWLLRSGTVLVGLVSSLPAWTMMDPLPILEGSADGDGFPLDEEPEEDDSLQALLRESSILSGTDTH